GVSTLAALADPYLAAGETRPVVAAVDARHDQVYVEVFGPGGRILLTPRLVPVPDALRAASGAAVIVGSGAVILAGAWPDGTPVPQIATLSAPSLASIARLGAAAGVAHALPKPVYLRRPDAPPQDAARLPRR